jgi:hypothetical protein
VHHLGFPIHSSHKFIVCCFWIRVFSCLVFIFCVHNLGQLELRLWITAPGLETQGHVWAGSSYLLNFSSVMKGVHMEIY